MAATTPIASRFWYGVTGGRAALGLRDRLLFAAGPAVQPTHDRKSDCAREKSNGRDRTPVQLLPRRLKFGNRLLEDRLHLSGIAAPVVVLCLSADRGGIP